MSFLNLSLPGALLLALATLGAVVLLFFLKLRRRRVVVGSALLWERVLEERQHNSLIDKLRKWLSLLLAATIALLIVLSIGRPFLGSVDDARPIALVLDTSFSMAAVGPSGQTRWERAVAEAEDLIDSLWTPTGIMIADTSGRIMTPLADNNDEIRRTLRSMSPGIGGGRFPRFSSGDPDVFFITDGVTTPRNMPGTATVVNVFEPADNVGITAFEIQVDPTSPSGYTAFIEVTNFSPGPKEAAIVIAGVGGNRIVRAAVLGPGEAWEEILSLEGFSGGGIQARIATENDALELDDVAFGYLPARGELDVTLVTPEPGGALATLLELAPEVRLTVSGEFTESVTADVYVFDRTVPEAAPSRPSLVFGVSPAEWLPPIGGSDDEIQLTSWDDEHPVMRFIPVDDLRIDRAAVVAPGDWNVIAASGNTPLILASPADADLRVIALTFDLADSDFGFHLGFPILVENTLAWFSGETLARVSGLGDITLPAGTTAVAGLDGTEYDVRREAGEPHITVNEPDLVTALVDGRRVRIAANLVDPAASAVNAGAAGAAPNPAPLRGRGRELWFVMLVAATILLAAEWWTYHRRITL